MSTAPTTIKGALKGAPKDLRGHLVPTTRPPVIDTERWASMGWPARMAAMREAVDRAARNNALRAFVVQRILKPARVAPTDWLAQAKAIHQWASKNLYYAREAGEFLQDPVETLRLGFGDCDDFTLFLAAAAESVGLPTRIVLQGAYPDGRTWQSGTGRNLPGEPGHVYVEIGVPEDCRATLDGRVMCRIDYRRSDPTAPWLRFGRITSRSIETWKPRVEAGFGGLSGLGRSLAGALTGVTGERDVGQFFLVGFVTLAILVYIQSKRR